MRIKNEDLTLDGTDLTSTIQSDPLWLAHIVNYSIQAVYSGTPNGTLKLQASNDFGSKDGTLSTITNWTDVPSQSDTISSAGSSLFNVENCGYRWVRLVWTDTSSGGGSTLTSARFNVKGI